jgi:hypothetical protein
MRRSWADGGIQTSARYIHVGNVFANGVVMGNSLVVSDHIALLVFNRIEVLGRCSGNCFEILATISSNVCVWTRVL